MKIVIIEDELPIAEDLRNTLQSVDSAIQVIEILPSVADALSYFEQARDIDLIYSDIQLSDGLSFEIFEQLTIEVPIIFCTAYNEYALNAFQTNGIDYILKPFSQASIAQSIAKYEQLKSSFSSQNDQLQAVIKLMEQGFQQKQKTFLVKRGDKFIPINIQDCALFFVKDGLTFAFTFEQKRFLLSETLDQIQETCGRDFYRANRQFLVNRKAIKEAVQYFPRKLKIKLHFDFKEDIVVGKLKVTNFLKWLQA